MNKQLLNEFTEYCEGHPDLTFWKALLGWIQEKHDANFNAIVVRKAQAFYDTINWDGQDNPIVLFKDEIK